MACLESTLQKFFTEAENHSKARFERLESQLDFIRTTLDKHAMDLDQQRKTTTSLQAQFTRMEVSTSEHNVQLKKLQDKVTLMEDHSRRNNLRIMNLKEGVEGVNVLSYLMAHLSSWFPELASNLPELMRAHRVGPQRKNPSDPPRAVIVKFLRFADRDKILGLSRKTPVVVDGLTLRFTADYSDATARRRRLCFPVTNRARSLGFHVFLLYPAIIKLTRGPDKITFEDPSEAAKYIDSFVHDASAVV
ncbi:hypothetical protein OJAV_G00234310 [Oryzias javanicus]|uniref:L1 transposable element RRM domain-containing protein n=1 Tax=Oryzias javanicus TaxID=123683 RepID=A0A437BYS7_ORYJA|nr:hypothetical protein OJAV_G00234310 [Oryzias javanicus]